jgi:hypothetical protein
MASFFVLKDIIDNLPVNSIHIFGKMAHFNHCTFGQGVSILEQLLACILPPSSPFPSEDAL